MAMADARRKAKANAKANADAPEPPSRRSARVGAVCATGCYSDNNYKPSDFKERMPHTHYAQNKSPQTLSKISLKLGGCGRMSLPTKAATRTEAKTVSVRLKMQNYPSPTIGKPRTSRKSRKSQNCKRNRSSAPEAQQLGAHDQFVDCNNVVAIHATADEFKGLAALYAASLSLAPEAQQIGAHEQFGDCDNVVAIHATANEFKGLASLYAASLLVA
jgi:hypothetical protein